MRGILVSSTVTACAAALTLPFLASSSGAADTGTSTVAARLPGAAAVPGSTLSLPLVPLGRARGAGPAPEQGLLEREVKPFSLIGIVWDDATAELRGRATVRSRAVGGGWSHWQDLQTHDDDRPDPDSAEGRGGRLRGSTAPLWVGASDAIQVRVRPEPATERTPEGRSLPSGLRLELVDPGSDPVRRAAGAPPDPAVAANASSAANAPLAPLGATEIPALARPASAADIAASRTPGRRPTDDDPDDDLDLSDDLDFDDFSVPRANDYGDDSLDLDYPEDAAADGGRYVGSRPRIVTRAGWGADESIRESGFAYTKKVKAAFVHHSASGNSYSCSQSASVIRGIYRYHVVSSGWRDIGYNFLVDKCGKIYEGRAGGVAKAVMGAHTLGFNTNSMGIAVLGTFDKTTPPAAAVKAISSLTAWKLGLFGANPAGTTTLVSGGGNLFKKGTNVKLKVISGHRDGYATECPGDRLYSRLGTARSEAARLQGR
ncbi:peptidoglycan recognition protein [Streptomyces sp. ISL-11]|uniref:peptidoglycan recognition protein family protein n=1 Tax=Streptomyces sp. ISL-11 TaxID=2819174 RepID=UPI001BE7FF04|nr:peptidoglycan recognition protein [Streptomyces sp. ISL-11]MBT2386838.1 peptidoglycan recognition protein [Streptomyces sp. ISL-11]